jgi:hypothetical protein
MSNNAAFAGAANPTTSGGYPAADTSGGYPAMIPSQQAQPQGKSAATVMMNDPRMAGMQQGPMHRPPSGTFRVPDAGNRGVGNESSSSMSAPPPGYGAPQPEQTGQGRFAGSRPLNQSDPRMVAQGFPPPGTPQPYTGGVQKISGVPVVNDTSSETGGDHAATIAMSRNAAFAMAQLPAAGQPPREPAQPIGAGLPRLHDDRAGQGTQMMNHARPTASAGTAMMAAPGAVVGNRVTNAAQPAPPQGYPPSQSQPQVQPQVQPQPQPGAPMRPGDGEVLTTVYRRERPQGPVNNTVPDAMAMMQNEQSSRTEKPRRLGLVIGIVVFVLIGFGAASLIIRFMR